MYILITYCSNYVPYKGSSRKIFFITGSNFTEEHIEEQDLGESEWEHKKRKKEGGGTLAQTQKYTTTTKNDLECSL